MAAALAAATLVSVCVFSFVFRRGTPETNELPLGIAGPSERVAALDLRVEKGASESFDVRRLDGAGDAQQALRDGELYVVVLDTESNSRRLV